MVSHNLAVVAHLCERIGVMQGGELVETLSADDLRAGRTQHPHTAALRELSYRAGRTEPRGWSHERRLGRARTTGAR